MDIFLLMKEIYGYRSNKYTNKLLRVVTLCQGHDAQKLFEKKGR